MTSPKKAAASKSDSESTTPPGDQWFQLQGASTVKTASYLEARIAAKYAAESQTMCLIYGDAGLGKTLAANDAVDTYRDQGLPVTRVEYGGRTSIKGVATGLYKAITKMEPSGERRHVEAELFDVLTDTDRLIVVDETQRLGHEALEYLRYLHDNARSRFGMLWIGGHGCWAVINRFPMLESRILVRVEFNPLTITETLKVIPNYHPIYEHADEELLRTIHARSTKGVFRSWAAFTRLAADVCDARDTETIDDQVAEIVFRLLRKGHDG
jgi:DNA transposition AAA+ family ATPase